MFFHLAGRFNARRVRERDGVVEFRGGVGWKVVAVGAGMVLVAVLIWCYVAFAVVPGPMEMLREGGGFRVIRMYDPVGQIWEALTVVPWILMLLGVGMFLMLAGASEASGRLEVLTREPIVAVTFQGRRWRYDRGTCWIWIEPAPWILTFGGWRPHVLLMRVGGVVLEVRRGWSAEAVERVAREELGRLLEVMGGLRSGQPADWPRRRTLVFPPRMSESERITDWTVGHIPLLKPVKAEPRAKESEVVRVQGKAEGVAKREDAGEAERKAASKGKRSEKGTARKTYRIPRERR